MKNETTIVIQVPKTCPECGQALPADSPRGLCSRCLMARALAGPDATSLGAPTAIDPAASTPVRIGDYELLEVIAQGGMGIVYRAQDTRLHRIVALKMIASGYLATEAEQERFKLEAEAAGRLEHPNIVPIYEVGEGGGRRFFTMKLVEHGSLAQAIASGPLPFDRAARLLAAVARAVHYAHQRGVLHRDIKPTNILLDSNDEPQLTDFGLAKVAESQASLTRSVAVMGSASYMSPEQARGQARQLTTATDIYSLGAVLYEAITGRPPFEGETMVETLRHVVEKEPRSPQALNPRVPLDLATICLKCLEKDPARRYTSARELAEELDRFRRREPILARPSSAGERALKWARRKPAIASLLLAVVVVGALGFGAVVWQLRQTQAALKLARQNALAEATAHAPAISARLVLRPDTALPPPPVLSASFSPDGRRIVTASSRTATLWDAADGKRLREYVGHEGCLASASFSRDGKRILTWSYDTQTRYAWLDPSGKQRVSSSMPRYGDQTARLWDSETGEVLTIVTNAAGQMTSAALSPDGKWIVTAGHDNLARVWDAATGQQQRTLAGHSAAILSVQFSPDGQRILTTSDGMTYRLEFEEGPGFSMVGGSTGTAYERQIARLWDVGSGREIGSLKSQTRLTSVHSGDSHTRARFSPDGRWLVTAPACPDNLAIWDARTGSIRTRLRGHVFEINDAIFSPDGQTVLTTAADKTARLWDASSGREIAVLTAHDEPVLSGDFSPDGKRCATAAADGKVMIWETATGRGLAVMKGHDGKVLSVRFSPDGARIVSAGEDGTARVWDAATLEQLSIPLEGHRGEVFSVQFSGDGRRVLTASADKTALVWDVTTGRLVSELMGLASLGDRGARQSILGELGGAVFSPDGRHAATASDDQQAMILPRLSLGVFRAASGRFVWPPPGGKPVPFTPVRVFETESGREILSLRGDQSGMGLVGFSPDGRRILATSTGHQRRAAVHHGGGTTYSSSRGQQGPLEARLWDAKTGGLVAVLPGHTNTIRFASFSPDGRWIVTGDQGQTRLWDAVNGKESAVLEGGSPSSYAIFSPDSRRILKDDWGSAALWEAETGRYLFRIKEQERQVSCAAFSPDGARIVLGGRFGACSLCDAGTGRLIMQFGAKQNGISQAVFSPDGRYIAVLDQTREARVWDTATGEAPARLAATLTAHKDTVVQAAFSPDGRWLATASKDFTARLWPMSVLSASPPPRSDAR